MVLFHASCITRAFSMYSVVCTRDILHVCSPVYSLGLQRLPERA